MKYSEMRRAARSWLANQELWMRTMVNPDAIKRDSDVADGFIDALRLLGIYSANQAKEAYKKLHAAHDGAIKEAALGVGSTESGKGDHPKKDDSLNHKSSVDEKLPDVKTGNETYIIVQSSGGSHSCFRMAGNVMDLACGGAAVISGLSQRLPRELVIAAILSGCDSAGISMDELTRTYKEAHDHG